MGDTGADEQIDKEKFLKSGNSTDIKNQMSKGKDDPKMKAMIKSMTPEDIFQLFDEDGSGLISYPEFKNMLPYLEINICDAKAYRYFKLCDTDGSGEIDIDEFRVALFTCDPTSGNPVGFKPGKNVTPMDAFEIFDVDLSGLLDEDEFFYAFEYLNIPLTDLKHEKYFTKIDYDGKHQIDFEEFRQVFIEQCDIKRELEDRGVDVPSFVKKKTLQAMLKSLLIDEEHRERLAIAEAKRYKKWLLSVRTKRRIIREAYFRAYQELRGAMDSAGHVYIFGAGSYDQFSSKALSKLKTDQFQYEFFEKIIELWNDRVNPKQLVNRLRLIRKAEEADEQRDADRNLGGLAALGGNKKKVTIDPYKEALESTFVNLNVQVNTVALWGRRIHHVTLSESVMFALADTGEVYTMGGNSFWWHEIQPDSLYQTKWRGDTTARSQLLMGTIDKELPHDVSINRNIDEMTPEDKKCEVIKVVAKYMDKWEPPPNAATRMLYFEKDLLPKLEYDSVKFALFARGKKLESMTKIQLMEELYEDILLEKKLLGERAHKSIRELETQVANLLKRKNEKLANKILAKIDSMWSPLREVQAEQKAAALAKKVTDEHNAVMKVEVDFENRRMRNQVKRDDMNREFTPRGNSLKINLSGVTPRAPKFNSPRSYEAAVQISAGAAHVGLVHKSGQLYVWGMGASGRLGLDLTEGGDPQKDSHEPKLVQALNGRPVVRVACGYSHTGAVVSGGDLYMWGSAANGKCGLGDIVDTEECYCSVPTRIIVGKEDKRVIKISCGAAHTGVITEQGQLYMFGCGDGGRLGLGEKNYHTSYEPTLTTSLLHERISQVSCGNTTTIVCTELKREWIGPDEAKFRKITGGRVYVAGSANVLGFSADVFTLMKSVEDKPIKMVSAGYQHSVLVSGDGELLCWGHNKKTCCGAAPGVPFVATPISVQCLYTKAANIALGKTAYQSSTFNSREAENAVNGETEGKGVRQCTCTQQDAQSWLEIDLGQTALIESIRLWNRSDAPTDKNQPIDQYTSRLFPCWVMVGQEVFSKELTPQALKDNLKKAVAKVKFVDNMRVSQWRCPANTQSRFVRIQLEGFNQLTIAELEVFGHWGVSKGAGRVSYAVAGRDVTVAVVRPSKDPRDVENMYKRAAWADSLNSDILRQYETYALEYDKFGRGEVLGTDCIVCSGGIRCETCTLLQEYADEIGKMPPAIGGRRRRLKSIDTFLIEANKPELIVPVVVKLNRPSRWEVKKQRWKNKLDKFLKGKIFQMFQKVNLHNMMKREDALETDPEDIMRSFQRNKEIAGIEEKEDAKEEADSEAKKNNDDEVDVPQKVILANKISKAGLKKIRDGIDGENDDDDMESTTSSIGESVLNDPSYYIRNQLEYKLKYGDKLPTGHVLKPGMPKAFTEGSFSKEEIKELSKKEERKAKLKAKRESTKNG